MTKYVPIWQVRDCPEWCNVIHRDTDSPVNRVCSNSPLPPYDNGGPGGVGLSLSQPEVPADGPPYLTTMNVSLEQGFREYEPRVTLSSRYLGIEEMTIAEAVWLLELLAGQITLARQAPRQESGS